MLSIKQFLALRPQIRALVFLFWIYSFAGSAAGIFIHIYLYQFFNSVSFNIIFSALGFTGCMIGFCGFGAAIARFRLNAKHGFLLSFLFSGTGLFLLPFMQGMPGACAAVMIRGIGTGLFWLTIHTYELSETRDEERDVYSTFLSAGQQLIILIAPAFAILLIWLSHRLGWSEFALLFGITPLVYLPGFAFFGALPAYRPEPLKKHDLVHFVSDRRNQVSQLYIGGGAVNHIMQQILGPLAAITVLGTALNVGGFNMLFAIAGVLVLLAAGTRRHPRNRLAFLRLSSIILAAFNVMLGASLTLVTLVIYNIGMSVMQPVMRVSQHVIDLQTMDAAGHRESDFYPTMILRDFSLWVWRMAGALTLLAAVSLAGTGREAISAGMFLIAGTFIFMYAGARLLLPAGRGKSIV